MFQSLIGTIKTGQTLAFSFLSTLLFQSLIGTIKTFLLVYNHISSNYVSIPYRDDKNLLQKSTKMNKIHEFQSLIGTIKTCYLRLQVCKWNFVSIPYRDDKNSSCDYFVLIFFEFQSLIGTIKTLNKNQLEQIVNFCFNPL